MNLAAQRRMASEILKIGTNAVWIDPEFSDDVLMAITREDIKNLIKEGIIKKRPPKGTSNSKSKVRHDRKVRGRARGLGKRKGVASARTPKKRQWINTIRPQRRELQRMRDEEIIDRSIYRKMYLRAKGGSFKSVASMIRYMEDNKMIKKKR